MKTQKLNMFLLKLLNVTSIVIILAVSLNAQKKENLENWQKIKVLVSNREQVEKLYGKAKDNQHNVYYQTPEGLVLIEYTKGDCKIAKSLWNVPEWTVTRVSYGLDKKHIKLKDLKLDKKQYSHKQSGDAAGIFQFYSAEKGIMITYNKNTKIIEYLILFPSAKDRKLFACDRKN